MDNLPLNQEVHLWYTSLNITAEQENDGILLLTPDELQRARRFYFPIHRTRFIAARSMLRCLLGNYLNINPTNVKFSYHPFGKPYVEDTQLQFNLSHSQDRAVCAFTIQHPVGVDIEKIRVNYSDSVAKRYFSIDEYTQLVSLPMEERHQAFYRIWSRKEALIKGLGQGLRFPLSRFSVSATECVEQITLSNIDPISWHLESFQIDSEYQSAFATSQPVKRVVCNSFLQ